MNKAFIMADSPIYIIGAGIAGLSAALRLAPYPVVVLTGAPLGEGAASAWAQGGVAAAMGADDNPTLHAQDTITAGAGLVDAVQAKKLASHAADQIRWLDTLGVPFDKNTNGHYVLGQEAAHSRRRIIHAGGDCTGGAIMRTLIRAANQTPSITVKAGWQIVDFEVAGGALIGLHAVCAGKVEYLPANKVLLATGGVGQLYACTTNPPSACGDGIAMAARAGARFADLEFVQFHPTALAIGRDPMPLLTEALRGDGARLVNENGQRFMLDIHKDAELAPRDIVARGIWQQIQDGHKPMLDARQSGGRHFAERFPFIYKTCREVGLDPMQDLLPVAPAAHYHMGGIAVDENGRSSLNGLWICGEVASTGVHGANRLASNSLLEALVYSEIIARDIVQAPAISLSNRVVPLRAVMPKAKQANLQILRKNMFALCGLVRSAESLIQMLETLPHNHTNMSSPELVAALITRMALMRKESRGGHMRSDYPEASPIPERHFLTLAECMMPLAATKQSA